MLPTDRADPEHPPFPSQVNPRRVRCAARRRCGTSRGSPQEAVVEGSGGGLPAASAAAVACDAAARRADAASGGTYGRSTLIRGAFDAPRYGDADRAADRPRRRPWWAAAAIRARPLAPPLRASQELQRASTRSELAARQVVAAQRFAALRMLREAEILIAAGTAPRGGPDGPWRCSARASRASCAAISGAAAARRADAACGGLGGRSCAP